MRNITLFITCALLLFSSTSVFAKKKVRVKCHFKKATKKYRLFVCALPKKYRGSGLKAKVRVIRKLKHHKVKVFAGIAKAGKLSYLRLGVYKKKSMTLYVNSSAVATSTTSYMTLDALQRCLKGCKDTDCYEGCIKTFSLELIL